ncbi:hypothetical protein HMPREF9374_3098 [Desmospora sp. 8437]|nr:hypothetical protein HMPREF9374_3098 [Desmospora sp. 8437]
MSFRCSYEPKSLHVKPNPPFEGLFHNAFRSDELKYSYVFSKTETTGKNKVFSANNS